MSICWSRSFFVFASGIKFSSENIRHSNSGIEFSPCSIMRSKNKINFGGKRSHPLHFAFSLIRKSIYDSL